MTKSLWKPFEHDLNSISLMALPERERERKKERESGKRERKRVSKKK